MEKKGLQMNVGFVSLGCSKNLVDTEMMIGIFRNNDFKIVNDPKEADIIVINTCGFIGPAKEEAINTLLEMAEYKKKGKAKYIIATGCLVERYKNELERVLPEIDLFIKFSEYNQFWEKVCNLIEHDPNGDKLAFIDRVVTTGKNYAYVRIAEGCDNFCTFCAIPYIRGRFNSRTEDDIIKEVIELTNQGYKEIILIAQDTTKYGVDIYGKPMLAHLIHEISQIDKVKWIRFIYSYPETLTDELIEEVRDNDKVCKYFDIPIQHISDEMLKKMNRKTTRKSIEETIEKIRKEIPDAIIRSTVMVGFPGETKEQFEELEEFIKTTKFDKLGCFAYSKEDGTPASKMEEQVHHMTKKSRYNKIMKLQEEISAENLKKFIGKTFDVLVESEGVGRTYMDVPEIDGVILFKGKVDLGTFTKCKVTGSKEYDLVGEIIK
jgi:ribosomal protein S12 methylthiotransferase